MKSGISTLTKDLAAMVVGLKAAKEAALEVAMLAFEEKAKEKIGKEHPGDWDPLKEETKLDRVRRGYAENEPLLRKGTMRDSIEHQLINENLGQVGSESKILVYQELGTFEGERIPPRPVIGLTAMQDGDLVIDKFVETLLGGLFK